MRRRDFVKGALAASVGAQAILGQNSPQNSAPQIAPSTPPPAPPGAASPPAQGPVPWMRGLMEAKPLQLTPLVPDAVAGPATHFFTDHQMATLRQLCEILLPPLKGYPGAVDAGTPEFLDFLISVSPADRRHLYAFGLDWLDGEARSHFQIPFDAVSATQANALLRPWLRAWMQDHPPVEPRARFINVAHWDICTATVNSEKWNQADLASGKEPSGFGLYWHPVDPDITRKYLPRS
jgi:Gluconate 2-dehydrogenase subunit 3